jgi:hypothetical protein
MILRYKDTSYLVSIFVVALVFLISAIVFSQYGFKGTLERDSANVIYSGQQAAQGIPHYVSIFNHSGPFAPLISGVAISVAKRFNFDDIFTIRVLFFIIGCFTVVALYLLGSTLFESRQAGLLAAFVFIGFVCFGRLAISGSPAKIPVVLFEILSLLLTVRKKWFWAGLFGSFAFLSWQPTIIYLLGTITLSIVQSKQGRERAINMIHAVSGGLLPIIIVSIYFLYKSAFYEFFDGLILFNLIHFERGFNLSYQDHMTALFKAVYRGYAVMVIPIILGLLMVCVTYIWRIKIYRGSIPLLLSKDRFAVLLLTFPAPVIWSVFDFQGCPDFYVFLPYVAIGFGWLLYLVLNTLNTIEKIGPAVQKTCFLILCAILVGSAAISYRNARENGLEKQRQWAQQVDSLLGEDSKLLSIGVPEILVLLHRTNPNPYVFIVSGFDNRIDANTPGGFDGWLDELKRSDPSMIAFGSTRGRFRTKLISWLKIRYTPIDVGGFTLLVKKKGANDQR